MKKMVMCLMIGIFAFSLVACGDTTSDKDKTNEVVQGEASEDTPDYKELTDPRGKTLESTATGESKPQIAETLYQTDDVVVVDFIPTEMGYAVDPSGATDSTQGIQQALYDCFTAGGGTVYLPAGNYAISESIYIPPHVTLRGDWQDPEVGTEYGTIISIWMEPEDSETSGTFVIAGNGGVIGLTIYYPLQSMECIAPYPYTFYLEENNNEFMLRTIKNVTIINGYRGFGSSLEVKHEELHLDNIRGTFLRCGIGIANSSDVGTLNRIIINNKYWKEAAADCMNAAPSDKLDAYTKAYLVGIQIGDLEWTTFNDIKIDNCNVGIWTKPGVRIDFAGTLYDIEVTDCTRGVVFDGLDKRWGACIARSQIEGGIFNNTNGTVKLCDVDVDLDTEYAKENLIMVDNETDLSSLEINYNKSYVKPATNLWVANLPSGLDTDASKDLQALLNKAGQKGGVVYVPGGVYCFKSPLTIPAGVELRGTSPIPARDSELSGNKISIGTRFYCYYGVGAKYDMDDQAFITLAGENAGLNGIRIFYPENSFTNTSDFRSTTYAIKGTASGVYVVNSMLAGSAYGVDVRNCDNHFISGVVTTCFVNTYRLGGKNGTVVRCLQNGTVMLRTKQEGLTNWLTGKTFAEWVELSRAESEFIIVEGAENQLIYHAFIYAPHTVIKNVNSKNTCAVNIGGDYLGRKSTMFIQDGGELTVVNALRCYGFSYDLLNGEINLYNRHAINEAGERTLEKSK